MKNLSNFAVTNPIIKAIIIPPWNATNSTFKPNKLITSGSTLPLAAEYALARSGCSIIAPITKPKTGEPP